LNGANNVTLQGLTFDNTGSGYADGAVSLTNSTGDQIIANDFNNNDTGIYLYQSNNNLISGNEVDNTVFWGIDVTNGSSNNTIDSNEISGTTLQGTGGGSAAIMFVNGGSNNAVTHNAISDTAGTAIGMVTWFPTSSSDYDTGDTIAYNSIINADSATGGFTTEGSSEDDGAIQIGNTVGNNQNININNNYIDILTDPANPTNGSFMLDVGIYLDDFASGFTVTNNIVQGGNLGFLIHGANDTLTNNVFDIGTSAGSNAGFFQYENTNFDGSPAPVGQTNDTASGNIIYSTANGTENAWAIAGVTANISGNLYYNTNGQPINTSGDSNPSTGNPQFANPSAGNFALASGSAASAIGFQSINQSAIGLAPTTAHFF
jgi:parallel beta-helix repeat protein